MDYCCIAIIGSFQALTLVSCCFFFFFFFVSWGKRDRSSEGETTSKLPPGTMGWPCIGETLQFYSEDPNVFFISRQKRYGEIFKTHILGCPCVMLAGPEAARFVLVTRAELFRPTYPRSKEKMIGPWGLFFHQGDYHLRIRRVIQGQMTPHALRGLVPHIDRAALSALESCAGGREIVAFHAMKQLSFDVGILTFFGGHLEERHRVELRKNYSIVDKGYNSFPTNIPGTAYHKSVQARKRLRSILDEIMEARRKEASPRPQSDLLGALMNCRDDDDEPLTADQIADNVIGALFAAQDTTASVMTWIFKFLHDHSKLLESIKAEHMTIYEVNEFGKKPLTWGQTRSMAATHRLILESLRMASIISFAFREAVADVEYKGYLIPKGWKVMPLFRNIHHSAEFFQDPSQFDPSRFEVAPRPNTFLPFGSGVHSCPGSELAKLEMCALVHHLVTKYRWEIVGDERGELEYRPFPVPKNGLLARLWKLAT